MKKSRLLGTGLIALGILLFYEIFFNLAPWLASLIPESAWSKLLTVIMYVVVGYFGGLAIPIFCVVAGGYLFVVNEW